jgi:transcriptional regulator NrdR family protein
MRCTVCNSTQTKCKQKYKPGDVNRAAYGTANLNRRRYVCFACNARFFTIEIPEPDFAAHYSAPVVGETKSRLR